MKTDTRNPKSSVFWNPFELRHSATVVNSYKYAYNKKELQTEYNLNWNDYGARNYDSEIGRWLNFDPLAENYSNISLYAYMVNNPLKLTGEDLSNAGGGFNYQTTNGSYIVMYINSNAKLGSYVNNRDGSVFSMRSKAGDLLAYELLGHGLTNYNPRIGSQYQNTIQLTNLFWRVINRGPRIYDNGSQHGGNPLGWGNPMPVNLAWAIPIYLQ